VVLREHVVLPYDIDHMPLFCRAPLWFGGFGPSFLLDQGGLQWQLPGVRFRHHVAFASVASIASGFRYSVNSQVARKRSVRRFFIRDSTFPNDFTLALFDFLGRLLRTDDF